MTGPTSGPRWSDAPNCSSCPVNRSPFERETHVPDHEASSSASSPPPAIAPGADRRGRDRTTRGLAVIGGGHRPSWAFIGIGLIGKGATESMAASRRSPAKSRPPASSSQSSSSCATLFAVAAGLSREVIRNDSQRPAGRKPAGALLLFQSIRLCGSRSWKGSHEVLHRH